MIPRLRRIPASEAPPDDWGTERVWYIRANNAEEWTPHLRLALGGLWHYWLRWLGLR